MVDRTFGGERHSLGRVDREQVRAEETLGQVENISVVPVDLNAPGPRGGGFGQGDIFAGEGKVIHGYLGV